MASHEGYAGAPVMAYCLVERESCDERLRSLRTPRSRTRCPTTKGVKAKEKVAQKVESIFKKPHRAAEKFTLKERKFEGEAEERNGRRG